MRQVTIKRDGVSIKIIEMFSGPGSGYEDVPGWVGRTMPVILFEVRLEGGRTCQIRDWKFARHELRITDEEVDKLISAAREAP